MILGRNTSDERKMAIKNAQIDISWMEQWQRVPSARRTLSFLLRSTHRVWGFPGSSPACLSPGPSWATSLCLPCDRALFLFNLSMPHPNPEPSPGREAREQQGAPCLPFFFSEGKIPSPVSCRDLINTCSEFRLLIQGTAPQPKLLWGSLSTY